MYKQCLLFVFLGSCIPLPAHSWAHTTLQSLSLDEKIGQLFMVATTSLAGETAEMLASAPFPCPYQLDEEYLHYLIKNYHIGGIIFLYRNSPETQVACTQRAQAASSIPLLVGLDAERGLFQRHPTIPSLPYATTLAATNNQHLIYDIAHLIGRQCAALGVHIVFAPVADVNVNPHNPVIHMRSFGAYAHCVAACVSSFVTGLQDAGVLACAKHFPGHGDTYQDSHLTCPVITHTPQELNEQDLVPFVAAIVHNVAAIMTAHIHVPALEPQPMPATLSCTIITDLLRTRLEFQGLIVTDGLGMKGITNTYSPGAAAVQALTAGNDILLCPVDVEAAHAALKHAVQTHLLSIEELDAHVLRILQAKEKLQLHTPKCVSYNPASLELDTLLELKQKVFDQALTYVPASGHHLPAVHEKIAYVTMGTSTSSSLLPQFLHEHGIPTFSYTPEHMSTLTAYEHVLVGLYPTKDHPVPTELYTHLQHLRTAHTQITVLWVGNVYDLVHVPEDIGVLIAYEDTAEAQKSVIALLTGTLKPSGVLPLAR